MVNVSSVIANVPVRGNLVNYGVAKAAQDALTRNLAFEFAPKGVRINSVLPGKHLNRTSACMHALACRHRLALWLPVQV